MIQTQFMLVRRENGKSQLVKKINIATKIKEGKKSIAHLFFVVSTACVTSRGLPELTV